MAGELAISSVTALIAAIKFESTRLRSNKQYETASIGAARDPLVYLYRMSLMDNVHHYSFAAGIMESWHAALETSFQYDSAMEPQHSEYTS